MASTRNEYLRKEDIRYRHMYHDGTHALNSLIISTIFFMFSMQFLKLIYEEVARFALLPLTVICDVLNSIHAYHIMVLSKYEGHNVAKFVIEVLGTLAIAAAVIGGIAFSAAFTLATPIIFAVTFGTKSLFHFASAIVFGMKAFLEKEDEAKHKEYITKAIFSFASGIGAALGTAAVIGVMFLGKPFMAIVGVVGGLAITAIAVTRCVMQARNPTKPEFDSTYGKLANELGIDSASLKNTHGAKATVDQSKTVTPAQPGDVADDNNKQSCTPMAPGKR